MKQSFLKIPITPPVIFATLFMGFYSFVIALMKDLPDT